MHGGERAARTRNGWTPLHLAARNDHVAVIELLVARGADINATNEKGATALQIAAAHEQTAAADALAGKGATGRRGTRAIAELLLAAGARTGVRDARGKTPLDEARANGNREVAAVLEGRTGS